MHSPFAEPGAAAPSIAGIEPAERRLVAGESVFREGEPVTAVYFLASGRIELSRVAIDGARAVMHVARAGEWFAEPALFAEAYGCGAMALEASRVRVYPRHALADALRRDPEALWRFTARLARHVHTLRMRLEIGRAHSAADRVLQLLRLRGDAAGAWAPPGTLKQLADELGLTHEALYRTLAKLEREGRIERTAGALILKAGTARPD